MKDRAGARRARRDAQRPPPFTQEQWTNLLASRKERLARLIELDAPDVVIQRERELVAAAETALSMYDPKGRA